MRADVFIHAFNRVLSLQFAYLSVCQQDYVKTTKQKSIKPAVLGGTCEKQRRFGSLSKVPSVLCAMTPRQPGVFIGFSSDQHRWKDNTRVHTLLFRNAHLPNGFVAESNNLRTKRDEIGRLYPCEKLFFSVHYQYRAAFMFSSLPASIVGVSSCSFWRIPVLCSLQLFKHWG